MLFKLEWLARSDQRPSPKDALFSCRRSERAHPWRTKLVGLAPLILVSAWGAAAQKPGVTVSFGDKQVVVSPASAGDAVLVYGVARDFVRVRPELLRWAKLMPAQGADGQVSFDVGRVVPKRSLWVVVDMSTGDYVVATPTPAFRRERDGDPSDLVVGAKGQPQSFKKRADNLDLVLVTPGVGAWVANVGSHVGTDAAGKAGWFAEVNFANMVPVAGSPAAPDAVTNKDLLFAIDPDSFEFSVVKANLK